MQIVVSAAMAAGTALVVAGRAGARLPQGHAAHRHLATATRTTSSGTCLTVRVEERVAFAVYRAVGFASVTGLVTP